MTRIISFWGKGGSGKTTLAAAAAVGLAREGYSVLAISSDPTPTLCLALGVEGGCGGGRRVRVDGVDVVELSEDDVVRLWRERFGDEVYEVVSAFLPVGREIVDYVAGAPGIADEFLMYYVYEEWRSGRYDYIVWDTPAAGGSIRLLRIEHELYSHLTEAAKLYLRVKGVLDRIRRREARRTPDQLIEEWRRLAGEVLGMLASRAHLLHIATTPDTLGLAVTRKLSREFSLHGIEVRRVIVNMVVERVQGCLETFREHVSEQNIIIKALEGEFQDRVCRVPMLPRRPRGAEQLLELWSIVSGRGCITVA